MATTDITAALYLATGTTGSYNSGYNPDSISSHSLWATDQPEQHLYEEHRLLVVFHYCDESCNPDKTRSLSCVVQANLNVW